MRGTSRRPWRLVGKGRSAAKALAGYTGIFARLAEDHGLLATLCRRLLDAPRSPPERRELFDTLRLELLAHAEAEEQEFHRSLRLHERTRELAGQGIARHHEMARLLGQMRSADVDTDEWKGALQRLAALLERHVHEEERQLFPRARDVLTKDEAQDMKQRFDRTRALHLRELARP